MVIRKEYPSVLDPGLHMELRTLAGMDWRIDETTSSWSHIEPIDRT